MEDHPASKVASSLRGPSHDSRYLARPVAYFHIILAWSQQGEVGMANIYPRLETGVEEIIPLRARNLQFDIRDSRAFGIADRHTFPAARLPRLSRALTLGPIRKPKGG